MTQLMGAWLLPMTEPMRVWLLSRWRFVATDDRVDVAVAADVDCADEGMADD